MPRKLKILLVDEQSYRRLLARELHQAYGHEIEEASHYEDAVQAVEQSHGSFDLAIVDYSLEGERSGIELLQRLHQIEANLPVIIITGAGDRKISQQALQAGAFWYLAKPHDWVELEMLLKWVGRYRATSSQRVNPQSVWGAANLWMPVSDAIVSAETIPELVDEVRTRALALLEATQCGILEVDPETSAVKTWPTENEQEKELLVKLLSPLARDMDSLEKPVLASATEIGTSDTPFRAWAACACPPAKGATEILFVLFEKDLTEEQKLGLELKLVTLARLIGVALENLRKAKLLKALAKSGSELLTVRSRSKVYEVLRDQMLDNLGVRTFYLALHKRSTDTVHCPLFFHQGEDILGHDRVPVLDLKKVSPEESFTVYVLHHNVELTVQDAKEHPTRPYPIKDARTQSYFAVPLHRPDGSAFGVLSIQSAVPRTFPEPLKQAVRTLASLVAPTLNRLRRNRLQDRLLEELMKGDPEAALRESLASIWEAVNADLVAFYPFDSRRKCFRLDRVQASPASFSMHLAFDKEIPTLNRLLELGGHFSNDAASDEVFGEEWTTGYGTKSIAGVVLRPSGTGTPSGIVMVHYRSPHDLDDELQGHIKRFSQYTAVAAHLIEQKEREKYAEMRRKALEILAGISDRDKLAQILEETLPQVWPAHPKCRFLLADRSERILYSPLRKEDSQIPFGQGLPGHVAKLESALLLESDSPPAYALSPETRSAIGVPVKLGDSLLGVITLESHEESLFEDEDRLFLEQIAKSAATILAAAGRKDNAQRIISAAREAANDPEHGLEIITESAHRIATQAGVGPTSTTVFLLTGKVLELASAWPREQLGKLKDRVGVLPLEVPTGQPQGIVALAALEGKSQMVMDVGSNKSYISFDEKTRAELAVPFLSADQRVIGVLNLEYENQHNLSIEDRISLEALADQMAIVAILQSKTQALVNQQDSAAETEDFKRYLEDHAAKGKLGLISENAHLGLGLISDLSLSEWQKTKRILHRFLFRQSIEQALGTLGSCFNRILNATAKLSSNGASQETITPLPIPNWASELIANWQKSEPTVEFHLNPQSGNGGSKIAVDAYQFTLAMDNIISNAVRAAKANSRNKKARVELSYRRIEGSIAIEVADNGEGIPQEIKRFLYLHRVPETFIDKNGHGEGCFYTGKTIRKFKGEVEVLTQYPEPAIIRIVMPLIGAQGAS